MASTIPLNTSTTCFDGCFPAGYDFLAAYPEYSGVVSGSFSGPVFGDARPASPEPPELRTMRDRLARKSSEAARLREEIHPDATVVGGGARGTAALTGAIFLLMFTYAISFTMLGPLLLPIRDQYGISLSQSGLMTTFQGVGGSLGVLVGILVADRWRRSTSLRATFSVYGLSVLLVVFLPYFPALVLLFFLIGASTRLTESLVNASVADIHGGSRGFYIILLHACFGVGALLGPIFSL